MSSQLLTIKLYFDGSAAPNPGTAACGAAAILPQKTPIQWSAPIGDATNNIAEYLGLIHGVRRLLTYLQSRSIRLAYTDLRVFGDSKVVIDQLNGDIRVRSPNLIPLHDLAYALVCRFRRFYFTHVPREHNQLADFLAYETRLDDILPTQSATYSPSSVSLVDVWVNNTYTLASHDLDTNGSDANCFIDAAFLQSLPEGDTIFNNMCDAHPLSVVLSDVNLPVLGTVLLDVAVLFSRVYRGIPKQQPNNVMLVHCVVVHSLPVPFHVSHRHPCIDKPASWSWQWQLGFRPGNLEEPYCFHPFWDE